MFKHLALLRNLRNSKGSWIPPSMHLYRERKIKQAPPPENNPPDKSVKSRQKNQNYPVYYCNLLIYRNFTLSVIQWLELKYCKSMPFLETGQATFCTVS